VTKDDEIVLGRVMARMLADQDTAYSVDPGVWDSPVTIKATVALTPYERRVMMRTASRA
jgi:hypothetical protein